MGITPIDSFLDNNRDSIDRLKDYRHKDREPSVDAVSLRTVRMSGAAYIEGIAEHDVEGVSVPIYTPAKTVADCFKFRNKIGLDIAIEALRDYVKNGGSVDELWDYRDVCRVQTVIRPYLDTIVQTK